MSAQANAEYTRSNNLSYHDGTNLLEYNATSLLSCTPRLAKNEEYASAVLLAWKSDVDSRNHDRTSIAAPITYYDANGCQLHGYVYRPSEGCKTDSLPGIIIFHTGAGPQDVFLRWKADALVTDSQTFQNGVVVLIADILGDGSGWAWNTDRSQYESVASTVLVPDDNGKRPILQSRVTAALELLAAQHKVDSKRIGVIGFCLGGHPVLELGRMNVDSLRAMVTFHGVFGSVPKMKITKIDSDSSQDVTNNIKSQCQVLICTGKNDPFVPEEDIKEAKSMFEYFGHGFQVVSYEGTKHGFTNPAQSFNTNPAFDYNEKSCNMAWSKMISLLKCTLKNTN